MIPANPALSVPALRRRPAISARRRRPHAATGPASAFARNHDREYDAPGATMCPPSLPRRIPRRRAAGSTATHACALARESRRPGAVDAAVVRGKNSISVGEHSCR